MRSDVLDPQEKARLLWRCRRGMLELDLILQHFLKSGIDHLTEKERKAFDLLLDNTDPQLLSWLMGHEDPVDKELYHLVNLIRNHH